MAVKDTKKDPKPHTYTEAELDKMYKNKGGRPERWTKEEIEKVATHLEKWAKLPDSIILREFSTLYERGDDFIRQLAQKSERFRSALRYAKQVIGARREKMAIEGKFAGDTSIIRATLATYDREHKETLIELKRAEAEARGVSYVEVRKYGKHPTKAQKEKKAADNKAKGIVEKPKVYIKDDEI